VALHPDFKPDVDLGKRITRQDVETMQRALGIAPEPECIMEQWEAALETLVRGGWSVGRRFPPTFIASIRVRASSEHSAWRAYLTTWRDGCG
jgi:hypothetical protein